MSWQKAKSFLKIWNIYLNLTDKQCINKKLTKKMMMNTKLTSLTPPLNNLLVQLQTMLLRLLICQNLSVGLVDSKLIMQETIQTRSLIVLMV